MNKIKYLVVSTFLMLLLFACQTTPDFVGQWELKELQLGNERITGMDIGNPTYTFNKDKTFTIAIDDLSQSGTWSYKNNKLSLVNDDDKGNENILTVVDVNDTIFHYTTGVDNQESFVYLRRIKK
ncbi:MAG: DUF4923 family protein [Chitinophagales bacterium]